MAEPWGSTTWTMGRVLERLRQDAQDVVVYGGEHVFRGVIAGIGEHLLTMETGDDIVVIKLSSISGVRLARRTVALPETAAAVV